MNGMKLPEYAHQGDAGFDLYASDNFVLEPMEKKLVTTGVKIEIPEGYVGLMWDKSGKALHHQLHCLAGVIDSSYRGELKVVMINLGKESFTFEKHAKVAQLLIQPVVQAKLEVAELLTATQRHDGGFGSTEKEVIP